MSMTMGAYNAVRVGDLEVAMVLAKEFHPASGRVSLTLAQLQAVFGATHLDSAERERIDAALEAAGLHAEPSVLDAHPDEALVFTVERAKEANGNGRRFARAPAAAPPAASTPSLPAAAIAAGILLPVLFTSVAGWRFGLAFVGFGAIAAGYLSSRGQLLRSGRTFLLAVGGLCVLSLIAAAVLATAGAGHR